jgi:uncharacterized protein (DUF2249 family)
MEPITATWKISRVLQLSPALLDVLIAAAPAFRRLRNPMVRRVQSRLVTVGQAAAIAGLEPADLVKRLNVALGLATDDSASAAEQPSQRTGTAPSWVDTAPISERFDVRPLLASGQEPFGAIMEAVRRVPLGHVLALRNTFEPTPLYEVLGQRGFEHWARQLAAEDWEILICATVRLRETRPAPLAPPVAEQSPVWDAPAAILTIDVSELVPPEPMIRILTALEELPAGSSLLVRHVRRPLHLYPRLDDLGYRHETRDLGPGRVELLIEKPAVAAGGAP